MKSNFTRQEVYDLVWSIPISKLAVQLKISERVLITICSRHQISIPVRSYWAKVEGGQKVTKTPLWKIDNPGLETVNFNGVKPRINPYVAFAIAAAQSDLRLKSASSTNTTPNEKADRVLSATQSDLTSVRKFKAITRPHPSISDLALRLKGARPDPSGGISIPGIRIHRDSRSRTVAFLHQLTRDFESRGIVLVSSERGLKASLGSEGVFFKLWEDRLREKHVPTPAELKKNEANQRMQMMAVRDGNFINFDEIWPEYDYQYSGKLMLEIIWHWADGARRQWRDGKNRSIEDMIDNIADDFFRHLDLDRVRRDESEERGKRQEHLAARKRLYEQRQDREKKRIRFIADLAALEQEAVHLKSVLEKAPGNVPTTDSEYHRMIEWAKARLAHLALLNDSTFIAASLKSQNLFPEQDDLFDPEGDPPLK